MKKFIRFLTVSILVMLLWCPVPVEAIPNLGVAPAESEYGIYYGPQENYLAYFADEFITTFGGNPGFMIPASGGTLSIWYGADNGVLDLAVDIYLATDSAAGDSFSFNGSDFISVNSTGKNANGYFPTTYYGVNLGSVNDDLNDGTLDDWAVLSNPYWPGEWYVYTGTIVYTGFLPEQQDWMFAMADINKNGIIFEKGKDVFSPKTTSSNNPIPEPATLFLLGTGLIALAGLSRKSFFN